MDGCFRPRDLEALQNLICPPEDDPDAEDDLPQTGASKLGEFSVYNWPILWKWGGILFKTPRASSHHAILPAVILHRVFSFHLEFLSVPLRLIRCIVREYYSTDREERWQRWRWRIRWEVNKIINYFLNYLSRLVDDHYEPIRPKSFNRQLIPGDSIEDCSIADERREWKIVWSITELSKFN